MILFGWGENERVIKGNMSCLTKNTGDICRTDFRYITHIISQSVRVGGEGGVVGRGEEKRIM